MRVQSNNKYSAPTKPKRLKIIGFIEIILIIDILQNLLFWININPLIVFFLNMLGIFTIIIYAHDIISKKYTLYAVPLILLTLLFIDQLIVIDGITTALTKMSVFTLGIALFLLQNVYKTKILKDITTFFSVLLLFSITAYVLFLILDFSPISTLSSPFGYEDHYNYIFFILPYQYLIPRFSGPFIEPGHLAIFCCFILFANKFQIKTNKKLIIYLIATLLSLSLAGYILLIISIIFSIKVKIKTIFIFFVVLLSTIIIISKWDAGNNPVYQMILMRLEYDDEKGISGNNRSKFGTDTYFDNFTKNGDICLGIGAKKYEELSSKNIIGGAGYKIFVIQYGIFGLLYVFSFYSLIALYAKNKRFSFCFLFLIMICFIQRSYPDWMAWLVPYICSCLPTKLKNNPYAYMKDGNLNKLQIKLK